MKVTLVEIVSFGNCGLPERKQRLEFETSAVSMLLSKENFVSKTYYRASIYYL